MTSQLRMGVVVYSLRPKTDLLLPSPKAWCGEKGVFSSFTSISIHFVDLVFSVEAMSYTFQSVKKTSSWWQGLVCAAVLAAVGLLAPLAAQEQEARGYFTVADKVKIGIALPQQKGIWIVDMLIDRKPFGTKVSNVTPIVLEWDTTKYPDGMHEFTVNAMFKDQRVYMQKQYIVVANDPGKRPANVTLSTEILFNPTHQPASDLPRTLTVAPDPQMIEDLAWARLREAGMEEKVEGRGQKAGGEAAESAIRHPTSDILREVVEKWPGTFAAAEASRWLGEYHFERDEWEKAAQYLNQYAVWSCLIRSAEVRKGGAKSGKRSVERTKPPEATALYHLARTYEHLNNASSALVAYQRLLDCHPTGPLAEASRRRLAELDAPGR